MSSLLLLAILYHLISPANLGNTLSSRDTTIIPPDKITIEEAFIEVTLLKAQVDGRSQQLQLSQQQQIQPLLQRLLDISQYKYRKPNDLLPSPLRKTLADLRQQFTKMAVLPVLKVGTPYYYHLRWYALLSLFHEMLLAVSSAYKDANISHNNQIYRTAEDAVEILKQSLKTVFVTSKKYSADDQVSMLEKTDLIFIEAAITRTRETITKLPKLDENGALIPESGSPVGSDSNNKQQSSSSCKLLWGLPFVVLGVLGLGYLLIWKDLPLLPKKNAFEMLNNNSFSDSVTSGFRSSPVWYILCALIVIIVFGGIYCWCTQMRETDDGEDEDDESSDEVKTVSKRRVSKQKVKKKKRTKNKKVKKGKSGLAMATSNFKSSQVPVSSTPISTV